MKNSTENKEKLPQKKTSSAKTEKKQKVEKKLTAKKLPSLFKKSYAEKKFNKKIISKLYVPQDKEFVSSLFKKVDGKKGEYVFKIPEDTTFTKQQVKKLAVIAKEIKANKGRIKFVPLLATVAFILFIAITVTVFKNPVAKWGIKNSMESIFGARCDIEKVNVEFFNSQITIKNFAQASKDSPMKNLFEFEFLDLDFNLSWLLRGRFYAENIEITGIKTMTDRTVSGKLPVKQKSKEEKEKKTDSTGFYTALKDKAGINMEEAKNAFSSLFDSYNPAKIAENIKSGISSPAVAKEVQEQVKILVEQWKNKPAELSASVEEVKSASEQLASLNVSNISSAQEIASLLKQIDEANTKVKSAGEKISSTLASFKEDQIKVQALQKKLSDAVNADKNLLSSSLSVFDISKAQSLFNDTFNQCAYSLLGKYYPYLKDIISYAVSAKSSSSGEKSDSLKESKQRAKKESKRFKGRNIFWKKDTVPSFLIENIHGSGKGIDLKASFISSDMDKTGKPWVISASVNSGTMAHAAGLTVDSRKNTSAPLLAADYTGTNFPLALDLSKTASFAGVPLIEGNAAVKGSITASKDFSFSGKFNMDLPSAKVTASPLENETAERIYSTALSSIKSLKAGGTFSFSQNSGISLALDTNFDKLLSNAISSVAEKELETVKAQAMQAVNSQLAEYTEGTEKYVSQFNDISSRLNASKSGMDDISKKLQAKKEELQKKSADSLSQKASSAAGSLLKGLKK